MIRTFKHKGLRAFFHTGTTQGIRAAHANRLRFILGALEIAEGPNELGLSTLKLHPLKGNLTQYWSVSVSGNWRIIFRLIEKDVELVDYLDYH